MNNVIALDEVKVELDRAKSANEKLRKTIHGLYKTLTKVQAVIDCSHVEANGHGNMSMSLVERVNIMKLEIERLWQSAPLPRA